MTIKENRKRKKNRENVISTQQTKLTNQPTLNEHEKKQHSHSHERTTKKEYKGTRKVKQRKRKIFAVEFGFTYGRVEQQSNERRKNCIEKRKVIYSKQEIFDKQNRNWNRQANNHAQPPSHRQKIAPSNYKKRNHGHKLTRAKHKKRKETTYKHQAN